MSDEQRLLLAYEMRMFARELSRARLRDDHPDWTDAQIRLESLRIASLPDPLPKAFEAAFDANTAPQ